MVVGKQYNAMYFPFHPSARALATSVPPHRRIQSFALRHMVASWPQESLRRLGERPTQIQVRARDLASKHFPRVTPMR
jgi:hypothetical protein